MEHMESKMQDFYEAAENNRIADAETGARALFRQHYQREPDSRDLKGLEMDSYRRIADTVLMAVNYPTSK